MDPRSIERAWRATWMRAIARMLPGERETVLPVPAPGRPLRVLFLRYERIGDMIISTGLVRVLARSSPYVTVDVVTSPAACAVLDNNPYVRRVFVLDRRSRRSYIALARALRAERHDVIVDGRVNNPRTFTSTPLLMLASGAPYRVGVGGGHNDFVYNVRARPYDRSVHYVEGSRALAEPFGAGVGSVDWRPEIFLSGAERDEAERVWHRAAEDMDAESIRLLVNLSASEVRRRWSDENFAEVLRAARAVRPTLAIVVIGLPAEWEHVRWVAAAARGAAAATPRLRHALALVGTSDRVLTPDTSISHAASAFVRPAVVLLKREHHPYAPWRIPGEVVYWDGDTIARLAVEPVRDAVLRLVAA